MIDKKFFKEKFKDLINEQVHEYEDWNKKLSLIHNILNDIDVKEKHDESNKGKSWTDDELRLVLQTEPTREKILLLSKAFKRGYGSIEQIFRWAAEPQKSIDKKRPNDKFVKQIKKIANEVGWRATG